MFIFKFDFFYFVGRVKLISIFLVVVGWLVFGCFSNIGHKTRFIRFFIFNFYLVCCQGFVFNVFFEKIIFYTKGSELVLEVLRVLKIKDIIRKVRLRVSLLKMAGFYLCLYFFLILFIM